MQCVYICMRVCVYIYIYIYTCIHTHTHTYIYIYMHATCCNACCSRTQYANAQVAVGGLADRCGLTMTLGVARYALSPY